VCLTNPWRKLDLLYHWWEQACLVPLFSDRQRLRASLCSFLLRHHMPMPGNCIMMVPLQSLVPAARRWARRMIRTSTPHLHHLVNHLCAHLQVLVKPWPTWRCALQDVQLKTRSFQRAVFGHEFNKKKSKLP